MPLVDDKQFAAQVEQIVNALAQVADDLAAEGLMLAA
jgi:hypothetical protein